MRTRHRTFWMRPALVLWAALLAGAGLIAAPAPGASTPAAAATAKGVAAKPTLVYPHLSLPSGGWAQVYSDGFAVVFRHRAGSQSATESAMEHVPLFNPLGGTGPAGHGPLELPPKGQLIADLARPSTTPYAAGQVVVIYRPGTSAAAVSKAQAGMGVDRSRPMFTGAAHRRMLAMRNAAQNKTGRALLDFPDARVLHVTRTSVSAAVTRLRANPDVTFAEPNWTVRPTDTPSVPISAAALRQARLRSATAAAQAKKAATAATAPGVPDNFTLTSSAQSMLNRPANDVVPAYTALAKDYGQLPGQGEIITNVSLGTLDDASAATTPGDPCAGFVSAFGPTTEVMNGQRYIDWPSMPLIPTYTSSSSGVLNPTGETCGNDDPQLTEVGLDFSMMAPLPHDQQRAGETGSGLTDLLGIAPGASYRLVIPSTPGGAVTDVDAALLAAANQNPRPDVMTVSLGFGLDAFGYPARYLEDDAMTEAVIASITASGIVVSVAGGDGLRTGVNTAVPPAGGSVATDVAATPGQATDLNDVADSSAPSRDPDSGAIDAGGSTLNDIFANPPQNPANAASSYLQAYPATRYDGGRLYASGFGSRVNVSAPGDNVLSFLHPFGGAANAVQVVLEGGTSASAPEAAAAAAIVLQVARLTGDKTLTSPSAVRSFLESTGTPLPAVPQSDTSLHVGPQIDVGHAVEELLADHGQPAGAGVARVAVAQRQQQSALAGSILTSTDPANISLAGRLSNAWITIAPDWTGLPRQGVDYKLSAAAGPKLRLAGTPWARLLPSAILGAAGLPLVSSTSQNVPLVYTASEHGKVVAQAAFTLTFGPTNGNVPDVPAPVVPSVVHGGVIPVRYDISHLTGATSPILVVGHPGRVDPSTGNFFRPAFRAPLTAPSGTIDVPVSALDGAGIYGVGIQQSPGGWFARNYSTFNFTRVDPTGDVQPPVPTLSAGPGSAGHFLEFGYKGSFQVHYDVSNVPGATGAIAEFSAPGPTAFNLFDTFNNPNGSERDNNGYDIGSVAYVPLPGTSGTAALNGGQLGLTPAMDHVVRVLATHNGRVTGEASGVSTISMDGIAAADGGSVIDGFGVDANGTDGLLTSNQVTASGAELGSIETFNQNTGATSTVVSSSDIYSTIGAACAGIHGNDTGLVDDFNGQTDTFDTLTPVSGGAVTGTWNPPASVGNILCAAHNQTSSQSALLNGSNGQVFVTPADFAAGTTGTPISITSVLQTMAIPSIGAFAENPATGHAYVGVSDVANLSAPATVIDVNLNSGQVSTFPAADTGFVTGMAIDPTTNKALIGAQGGYSVEDLATHAGTFVTGAATGYEFPAWSPGTHNFLIQEPASPDFFGSAPDNNTLSSVLVVDENGTVVHRYEQFNFFNTFLFSVGDNLQASSATSRLFAFGPGAQQLHPLAYQAGQ